MGYKTYKINPYYTKDTYIAQILKKKSTDATLNFRYNFTNMCQKLSKTIITDASTGSTCFVHIWTLGCGDKFKTPHLFLGLILFMFKLNKVFFGLFGLKQL